MIVVKNFRDTYILNVETVVTKVTVVTILIVVTVATVVTVGDNFKWSEIIDNGYSSGISDISENMEFIKKDSG